MVFVFLPDKKRIYIFWKRSIGIIKRAKCKSIYFIVFRKPCYSYIRIKVFKTGNRYSKISVDYSSVDVNKSECKLRTNR